MPQYKYDNIAQLHDRLTIKLLESDYKEEYKKQVEKIAKTINLPGFRKGFVPSRIVEKIHGNSIFNEELIRMGEKNLYDYLKENNIEIIYKPILTSTNLYSLKSTEDFVEFEFEFGIKPKIDLSVLKQIESKNYKVIFEEKEIEDAVVNFQLCFGEKKELEKIKHNENLLLFVEVWIKEADDKEEIKIKSFNFPVEHLTNESYNSKYRDKKIGDTINFELSDIKEEFRSTTINHSPSDQKDLWDKKPLFKLKTIKNTLPKELGKELFELTFGKDYKIETIEDYKARIKENITSNYFNKSRSYTLQKIKEDLNKHISYDLPVSFIKKWIENHKVRNASKSLSEVDSMDENNLEKILEYIRKSLLENEIIITKNISVSEEEIKNYIKFQLFQQSGNTINSEDNEHIENFISKMLKNEKYIKDIEDNILISKCYEYIYTQANILEESISKKEFEDIIINHKGKHQSEIN